MVRIAEMRAGACPVFVRAVKRTSTTLLVFSEPSNVCYPFRGWWSVLELHQIDHREQPFASNTNHPCYAVCTVRSICTPGGKRASIPPPFRSRLPMSGGHPLDRICHALTVAQHLLLADRVEAVEHINQRPQISFLLALNFHGNTSFTVRGCDRNSRITGGLSPSVTLRLLSVF